MRIFSRINEKQNLPAVEYAFLVDFLMVLCYYSNMDIKENVAKNLVKYRKLLNLTQNDLAEKLNYSNKAISKWERMESVPDIYVLSEISTLFGITVDELISPPTEKKPSVIAKIIKGKVFRGLATVSVIFMFAFLAYLIIVVGFPQITNIFPAWIIFIYAVPISFLSLCINWRKGVINLIFSSLLCWTILTAVFLTTYSFSSSVPNSLWEIFLLGIPVQAGMIFVFFYKKNRINRNQTKKAKNNKK